MKCFNHEESDAVGICKSCQKAVCRACAIDTGRGLACSESCAEEIAAVNIIIDKNRRIYGIDRKSALLPTGVLMLLFFGMIFSVFGIIEITRGKGGTPDVFLFIMGAGCLVLGIIGWYRNRKLNLNY